MYIGSIGSRISIRATYLGHSSYYTQFNWSTIEKTVFRFADDADNMIIWDTTSFIEDKKLVDKFGQSVPIPQGSVLDIKATVKAHKEYKGIQQTVLSRPVFTVVELAKTKEETQSEKRASQLNSLEEGDAVVTMRYKQYKEHYADCETLNGSYDKEDRTVDVIVRNGRLKASGVRGKHFMSYQFTNDITNKKVTYLAVCEGNAHKRVKKAFPEYTWWCCKIF